jgi:hypothetical protein
MKEEQQIIFKHPALEEVRLGVIIGEYIHYLTKEGVQTSIQHSLICEWCDAEAAFNAFALQNIRAGNFEEFTPVEVTPKLMKTEIVSDSKLI